MSGYFFPTLTLPEIGVYSALNLNMKVNPFYKM